MAVANFPGTSKAVLERFGARNDRQTFNLPTVAVEDIPPSDRPAARPAARPVDLNQVVDFLLQYSRQNGMTTDQLIELIRQRDKANPK